MDRSKVFWGLLGAAAGAGIAWWWTRRRVSAEQVVPSPSPVGLMLPPAQSGAEGTEGMGQVINMVPEERAPVYDDSEEEDGEF